MYTYLYEHTHIHKAHSWFLHFYRISSFVFYCSIILLASGPCFFFIVCANSGSGCTSVKLNEHTHTAPISLTVISSYHQQVNITKSNHRHQRQFHIWSSSIEHWCMCFFYFWSFLLSSPNRRWTMQSTQRTDKQKLNTHIRWKNSLSKVYKREVIRSKWSIKSNLLIIHLCSV